MTANAPSRGEQLALVVFLCAAVAAFGSSYQQPAIWVFWLPAVASVFWRLERVPPAVHRWARYGSWALLAVVIALGLVLMAYSVLIAEQTAKWLTLITGYALALFASTFLLGSPVWSPVQGFLPAATGLLVVASLNPTAKITPLLVAPGAAIFVYLLLTKKERSRPWHLISARLVITALASAALAWSFYAGLPRLQKRVESATLAWFASQTGAGTPTALQSRVGELEELKLSKRVVMRVWTNQPQKLRGRVYARFDGRSWQARITPATPLSPMREDTARYWLDDVPGNAFAFPGTKLSTQGTVVTRVFQTVITPGVLVSPGNKVLVRAPLPNLSMDASEGLSLPLTAVVRIYGTVNRRSTEGNEGTQPEPEFLVLPLDLDSRWRQVAQQLESGATSDAEKVERTVDYLKHAATYSLQVGKFHTRDPVTEFLFEKKRGYCQYFASAAVILLRLQGVPARYVTGYTVQEFNNPGGHYVVRDADAHAWVEVFTARAGWVEADPTPEAEFEERRQAGEKGRFAQAMEWMAAAASELWVRVREGDWRGALANARQAIRMAVRVIGSAPWLLLLFFILSLAALWRRLGMPRLRKRNVRTSATARPLKEFLDILQRCWEAAGYPRPASRGLLEHVEGMPEKMAPGFRLLSRRFVDAYYCASFGKRELSPSELRELDQLAARLAHAASSGRTGSGNAAMMP